ncbi:MAG: hypothetical protein KatS3mg114_1122 [Planctomycetaceae bacterium]|nr:MAG: hypothetical protein KatS3mg114_1122 [Planctomycetaceae bacterium]
MARSWRCHAWWLGVLLALFLSQGDIGSAGHVRLKNGMLLEGKPARLLSIHDPFREVGPIPVYKVIQIDRGLQRYYVPLRQVPEDGLNLDTDPVSPIEFTVPQPRGRRELTVKQVGNVTTSEPFDPQFGRRTVTLYTPRGPLNVVQGISRITPEYVWVSGITHQWEYGLALHQVPAETLISILRNPVVCSPDDIQARMARLRLFLQAGWYPAVLEELQHMRQDFPDWRDRLDLLEQEAFQGFGRHVLRELKEREQAGQVQLALQAARSLMTFPLAGGIRQQVAEFVHELQQRQLLCEQLANRLSDLQAQVRDADLREQVGVVRSQLLAEFDVHAWPRLQALQQVDQDRSLSAEEKLALAFSGWLFGSSHAETDLLATLRWWRAREIIREYLHAELALQREQLAAHIQQLDGLNPTRLEALIQHLPPVLDDHGVLPMEPQRIEGIGEDGQAWVYWVCLPPEYSPGRVYPCLLALPPAGQAAEKYLQFWAGTRQQPAVLPSRGVILIVPEYLPPDAVEYTFSASSHAVLKNVLRDVRLRWSVDANRIFLTGHQAGADAAFDFGLSHPDEFAGVIPIAGLPEMYCHYYRDNGNYTAWYIVRGELGRDSDKRPVAQWLDRWFTLGAKYDLIYTVYLGRGQDPLADEIPRFVEWMFVHQRSPVPREFEYLTLRQYDNNFYWLTAHDLPRHTILQTARGDKTAVEVMRLSGRINEGNTITVRTPARKHRIRLLPGLVDFDRKITVNINGVTKLSRVISPDIATMLEDYRQHGDRQRIAHAALEF